MLELRKDFQKDVSEDAVLEFVDVYLLEEFLETEPIRIKIDEVRKKLEGSPIHKSKRCGLKILLDDSAQNRQRVQAILTRMAAADGEEAFTLNTHYK